MKYRKKPVVIEAVQWNGENLEELITFLGGADTRNDYFGNLYVTGKNFIYHSADPTVCNYISITIGLTIKTLEGDMKASVGDYIIKGIKGDYYPCKPDIFEATYDATNEGEKNSIYTDNLDNLDVLEHSYPHLLQVLIRLIPNINKLLERHGLFINHHYVLTNSSHDKFRPHHISFNKEGTIYTEILIGYYGNEGLQKIVIRNQSDIGINFPEWIVQEKSLTFGENLMGITLDPSGNPTANEIKTKIAEIVNLINKHYEDRADYQFEALIIYQNCLQHLLDAQLNCVKLVTYKK